MKRKYVQVKTSKQVSSQQKYDLSFHSNDAKYEVLM